MQSRVAMLELLAFNLLMVIVTPSLGEVNILKAERYDLRDVSPSQLRGAYGQLDSELVSKVQTADPQANIQAAMEIFNQKYEEKVPQTDNFMKALRLFQSLGLMNDKNVCNDETYRVLVDNKEATSITTRQETKSSPSRTAQVVAAMLEKHSAECKDAYPSRLLQKKNTDAARLQKHDLEIVDRLYKIVYTFWMLRAEEEEADKGDFLFKSPGIVSDIVLKHGETLHDHVKKMIFAETVGLAKVDPLECYQKYLQQPCSYTVQTFGYIFEKAAFDEIFGDQVPSTKNKQDFYPQWARYELCKSIVNNWDQVMRNAKEFVTKNGIK